MAEPDRTPSAAELRISDADRQRVAELLRDAAGEGRIDMDELDERLESAWQAKTYGDLVPLTADLPVAGPSAGSTPVPRPASHPAQAPATPTPAGPGYSTTIAIMSGPVRRGAWTVADTHTAVAFWGGADIDLRQAHFTARETTIYASAVMGAVDVIVNERTHVVVEGVGIMGAYEECDDKVEPRFDDDSPVVRVKGFALMGAVSVTRKGPSRKQLKEQRRKQLGH